MSFKITYEQGTVSASYEIRTNLVSDWEMDRIAKFIELCNETFSETKLSRLFTEPIPDTHVAGQAEGQE